MGNGLYLCGWLLFVVSFALPAVHFDTSQLVSPNHPNIYGWEAALWSLQTGPLTFLFWNGLSNVLFPVSIWIRRSPKRRIPGASAMTAVTLLNILPATALQVRIGYWLWLASFTLITVSLWLPRTIRS